MPTPVSAARQCLTPEAATALDGAVSVARRRSHPQTTSLHVVSALLSLPSSSLLDACCRSRNSAYSPRLQFKALELCLSVSLDRVPSSAQLPDDPPVSNSLMAAIKRAQANQRRQPENFHLYHQMALQCSFSSSSPATSPSSINNMIKVELQHLILSILDDPVVSRVFGEAGFSSTEIKLAIARPLPHLFRYGRPRGGAPLFLPDGQEFGPGGRRGLGFNFPFPVFSDVNENCRRIGELLVRSKGRNPLLVGVCAIDALRSFIESVKSKKEGCLPMQLSGLSVISAEDGLSKLVAQEKVDEARLELVFGEVSDAARQCSGAGVLVDFEDLNCFVSDRVNSDMVSLMVSRLARLLEVCSGKVWFIGATTSYDTYLKFLSRYPSAEKELDLQILPITTLRPSAAESGPRSSLMESFVPFAGFFSSLSELIIPVSGNSYQSVPSRDELNKTKTQEAISVTREGATASVADQYQCSLPSWLRMAELGTKAVCAKNKNDGSSETACTLQTETELMSAKESQQKEKSRSLSKTDSCLFGIGSREASSSMSTGSQKAMTSQHVTESCQVPKSQNENFLSKHMERPSNVEHIDSHVLKSPNLSWCNSSTDDGGQTSPASATSIPTTSLSSGANCASEATSLNAPRNRNQLVCQSPQGSNSFKEIIPGNLNLPRSSCGLSPDINVMNFKMLYGDLIQKMGRQAEAVRSICEVLCRARRETHCKAALRGDLWFTFLGSDRIGKMIIASALSNILRKHLIYVDLCPRGIRCHDVIFSEKMKSYDSKYRGKTTVDVIAGELGKNPCSIIFLENIEKADEQLQNNLSQAFCSGKFSDSYGREVSMSNAVVIAASSLVRVGGVLSVVEELGRHSEDRVLGSECWQMKILVERATWEDSVDNHDPIPCMLKTLANKRKLPGASENVVLLETSETVKRANMNLCRGLDLNLPAEGDEAFHGDDDGACPNDTDAFSGNLGGWLSEFLDRMDGEVSFKPQDLDALADDIFMGVKNSFQRHAGPGCSLEVDSKVLDQLLLAAYLSNSKNAWEEWLTQVLDREFAEVRNRFKLAQGTIVVKLLTTGELLSEDQAFGGHANLPSRIIIHPCPSLDLASCPTS
ncbi:hypothetical protein MLD38_011108 [Melastoma candidum]|uniref:Uncharacterized protein n=1 Tax=Melastoma candidum TaxID=119954 RepID=A0ACB9R205_9MYRT|nr:hypothetical protein MLD38_011108 [Melastoma candidum]